MCLTEDHNIKEGGTVTLSIPRSVLKNSNISSALICN